MDKPQNISSLHATWRPGDVVLDADGRIRVRSAHVKWVWDSPGEGDTRSQFGGAYVPEGGLEELEPIRPLTLLVREGQAVAGHIAKEEPPTAQDVGEGTRFRMHGSTYRVSERDGDMCACQGFNGLKVAMTAGDVAAWKGREYDQVDAITQGE